MVKFYIQVIIMAIYKKINCNVCREMYLKCDNRHGNHPKSVFFVNNSNNKAFRHIVASTDQYKCANCENVGTKIKFLGHSYIKSYDKF